MTPELVLAAARLVDDIAGRAERDAAVFEFAFRLGYGHGHDIGVRHGHEQLADWWRIDRFPNPDTPAYAELQKRRYPPDGDEAAWIQRRRHTCYRGGPVPWQRTPPSGGDTGADGRADNGTGEREGDAA